MNANCNPSLKTQLFFARLACPTCFYLKENLDIESDLSPRECVIRLNPDAGNMVVE